MPHFEFKLAFGYFLIENEKIGSGIILVQRKFLMGENSRSKLRFVSQKWLMKLIPKEF